MPLDLLLGTTNGLRMCLKDVDGHTVTIATGQKEHQSYSVLLQGDRGAGASAAVL